MWKGETAFLLAGGPSLTQAVADRVRGLHTIAINSSAARAPWAEVLFFTDNSWFEKRRDLVANWPGLVVSMSRHAKRELPGKILRLKEEVRPDFPPPLTDTIRHGRSSGHRAVSLAIALGAANIILLGYDMRVVDGREHHHDEYAGRPRNLAVYEDEFLPSFRGWNDDARRAGSIILNATPGSALKEFPMVDLDEVLACAPS